MEDLERVQVINAGLSSPFWKEILKPMLEQRKLSSEIALRNPSVTRKHALPDDYLRGILDLAEELLNQPPILAESIQNAAVEEKLAEQRDLKDSVIAHFGRGSHIED